MLIEHNREKLINAIIYFLEKTKYCGKTKIFKLLYFLDFLHFRETGKSVTGLRYFAWPMGPVPKDLYEELGCPKEDLCKYIYVPEDKGANEFFGMKPKKKFDDKYFSQRELRLMARVAEIFKDAKADVMTEASHFPNMPWDQTIRTKGKQAEIDYFLALDNTENSLSPEEVRERIRDSEEIRSLFE